MQIEGMNVEALREVYDDAPDRILPEVPPEFRHRRVEVILAPVEDLRREQLGLAQPKYRTLKVKKRIISERGTLHER
jgi:hypothetical protein